MPDLLTSLATNGISSGVVLGLAYLYIRHLDKQIRDVENKRVEDNKAMVSKLLELNDKWSETLNAQSEVIELQKQALTDIRQILMDERRPFKR